MPTHPYSEDYIVVQLLFCIPQKNKTKKSAMNLIFIILHLQIFVDKEINHSDTKFEITPVIHAAITMLNRNNNIGLLFTA